MQREHGLSFPGTLERLHIKIKHDEQYCTKTTVHILKQSDIFPRRHVGSYADESITAKWHVSLFYCEYKARYFNFNHNLMTPLCHCSARVHICGRKTLVHQSAFVSSSHNESWHATSTFLIGACRMVNWIIHDQLKRACKIWATYCSCHKMPQFPRAALCETSQRPPQILLRKIGLVGNCAKLHQSIFLKKFHTKRETVQRQILFESIFVALFHFIKI